MASLNTNTVALGTVIRQESWYKLQETLDHVSNLNQKKLQSKESQLVPGELQHPLNNEVWATQQEHCPMLGL